MGLDYQQLDRLGFRVTSTACRKSICRMKMPGLIWGRKRGTKAMARRVMKKTKTCCGTNSKAGSKKNSKGYVFSPQH